MNRLFRPAAAPRAAGAQPGAQPRGGAGAGGGGDPPPVFRAVTYNILADRWSG